jgi:hypothetical protein
MLASTRPMNLSTTTPFLKIHKENQTKREKKHDYQQNEH